MKNIKLIFATFLFLLVGEFSSAQVLSNGSVTAGSLNAENPFFDASTNFDPNLSFSNSIGKGLVFPRTDLTVWEFSSLFLDGSVLPTAYDGMVVFNTGTGSTLTTGNNPSTASIVSPGFYYFSNPTGDVDLNVANGRWLPLGGSSTKTKEVVNVVVPANPTTATLNLGTTTIAANEVTKFLGAKVYNAAGDLVLEATSEYDKATNVLTTGNGFINHVLPAGTYSVVVEFE